MLIPNELNFEEFIELIDNIYDEIFIWDKTRKIFYANKAVYRHYGLHPKDMVGKTLEECTKMMQLWSPTCVMDTFEDKKPVIQRQKTLLGINITTISVPIFDSNNEVKYVIQSVRDEEKDLFKKLSSRKTISGVDGNSTIIYKSEAMKSMLDNSKKVAKTKAPVLILGETGTGKSMLAKYIHQYSDRKEKPFININIASLNPTLIESEFFGYKKGAFTGAVNQGRKGFFESANGGTIFLDEIGEIPYELQAKFLHALQDEEIIPVGSVEAVKLDIRVICATNCDLKKLVEAGKFRKDLYHRLNIFEITIPPLRKRRDDLRLLIAHFLNIFNQKYEKNVSCSNQIMDMFLKYIWSGNIRELSNVIERGVITAEGDYIVTHNLPESFFSMDNIRNVEVCAFESQTFDEAVEKYERELIIGAHKRFKSTRRMAEELKISQSKASRLVRKYILEEKDE